MEDNLGDSVLLDSVNFQEIGRVVLLLVERREIKKLSRNMNLAYEG